MLCSARTTTNLRLYSLSIKKVASLHWNKYIDICMGYNSWYIVYKLPPKFAGQYLNFSKDTAVIDSRISFTHPAGWEDRMRFLFWLNKFKKEKKMISSISKIELVAELSEKRCWWNYSIEAMELCLEQLQSFQGLTEVKFLFMNEPGAQRHSAWQINLVSFLDRVDVVIAALPLKPLFGFYIDARIVNRR